MILSCGVWIRFSHDAIGGEVYDELDKHGTGLVVAPVFLARYKSVCPIKYVTMRMACFPYYYRIAKQHQLMLAKHWDLWNLLRLHKYVERLSHYFE